MIWAFADCKVGLCTTEITLKRSLAVPNIPLINCNQRWLQLITLKLMAMNSMVNILVYESES